MVEKSAGKDLHRKRSEVRNPLPTNKMALDRQFQVLIALVNLFETTRKPVRLEDICKMLNMPETTIHQVRTFFRYIKFWEKKGRDGFIPAREVSEFYHAYQAGPEDAPRKLVPLLEAGWFTVTIRNLLKSGTVQVEKLTSVLLQEANLTFEKKGQISNLIKLMKRAGMLRQEGSLIRRGDLLAEVNDIKDEAPEPRPRTGIAKAPSPGRVRVVNEVKDGSVVEIRISFTPAMLVGWDSQKLQAFFGGISNLLAYATD